MIFENGCIETLSIDEAEAHGNYVIVEEEINEQEIDLELPEIDLI
jgi:hypothetical protein